MIITFCTIFIFLCGELSISFAQNNLFRLADSLYSNADYKVAAIEYERICFLSDDNFSRTDALLKKAQCLKQLQKFSEAEDCLMRVNFFELNDTLTSIIRYQTALCAYLSENFTNAEFQLIQLHHFIKDSTLTQNSLVLYGLVLNELGKWNEAKDKIYRFVKLSDLSTGSKDSLFAMLDMVYTPQLYPKLKKLKKAQLLSAFIPGSGQIYLGYPREGIVNALLQASALALTAYGIITQYYVTSLLVSYGLFQRFYTGGIKQLDYLVNKRNHFLLRDFNNKLKDEILIIDKKCK